MKILLKQHKSNLSKCKFCETLFVPRTTGGSQKKFCNKNCKDKFHSHCKQYSRKLFEQNRISIEELINLDINRSI